MVVEDLVEHPMGSISQDGPNLWAQSDDTGSSIGAECSPEQLPLVNLGQAAMTTSSSENSTLVRDRKVQLRQMMAELGPTLVEFLGVLQHPNPNVVLSNPGACVLHVDQWLSSQAVVPESRTWLLARVAYFIGEVLRREYGGDWGVDEVPSSPWFGHILVGNQNGPESQTADPFALAARLVDDGPGRSLIGCLSMEHDRRGRPSSIRNANRSPDPMHECAHCRQPVRTSSHIGGTILCEVCISGMLGASIAAILLKRGVNVISEVQKVQDRLRSGELELDDWLRETAAVLPR